MNRTIASTFGVLLATVILAGCAGTPAKIVSSTESGVAIAISEKAARNLDDALVDAGKVANEACGKHKKIASLARTEDAAKGVVAHFECIAPPPPAKPAS